MTKDIWGAYVHDMPELYVLKLYRKKRDKDRKDQYN